jgi:hypothetical protein
VQQGLVAAVQQKAAHRNLRVLLSVGGGGRSDGFIFVSKRSADRTSFVQKLVMLCNEQGLDGIDFDWEGIDFLQNRDMLTAYTQLLIQARNISIIIIIIIIIILIVCNFCIFVFAPHLGQKAVEETPKAGDHGNAPGARKVYDPSEAGGCRGPHPLYGVRPVPDNPLSGRRVLMQVV